MTGAQHYAEAERLLADVAETAAAQVHATLALAAATLATSNRRVTDADDWAEAIRGA